MTPDPMAIVLRGCGDAPPDPSRSAVPARGALRGRRLRPGRPVSGTLLVGYHHRRSSLQRDHLEAVQTGCRAAWEERDHSEVEGTTAKRRLNSCRADPQPAPGGESRSRNQAPDPTPWPAWISYRPLQRSLGPKEQEQVPTSEWYSYLGLECMAILDTALIRECDATIQRDRSA